MAISCRRAVLSRRELIAGKVLESHHAKTEKSAGQLKLPSDLQVESNGAGHAQRSPPPTSGRSKTLQLLSRKTFSGSARSWKKVFRGNSQLALFRSNSDEVESHLRALRKKQRQGRPVGSRFDQPVQGLSTLVRRFDRPCRRYPPPVTRTQFVAGEVVAHHPQVGSK